MVVVSWKNIHCPYCLGGCFTGFTGCIVLEEDSVAALLQCSMQWLYHHGGSFSCCFFLKYDLLSWRIMQCLYSLERNNDLLVIKREAKYTIHNT